ncbi:MAG: hypothetical protein N4A62_20540 [Marinisporobacter sp.]|jgi:phage protein D|nr:hypothetical protein [Marinisporobacter sp.]
MDKGSYTYDDLKKKYKNFTAPDCVIKIGGSSHKDKKLKLSKIEVNLTAGLEAGGCTFEFIDCYDLKNGAYKDKWMSTMLVPGKVVEVEMGYIKKKKVFHGLIVSVMNQFDHIYGEVIIVNCMDAKGAMMAGKARTYGGEKKLTDIVKATLNKYKANKLLKTVTVDKLLDLKRTVIQNDETDYDFLTSIARRVNYEFFVIQDEVLFCKPRKIKKPIISFTWRKNIIAFSREVDLTNQIKEVKVIGNDELEKKEIVGKANKIVKTSKKGAADSYPLVKKRTEVVYDSAVRTVEEANALAKSILEEYAFQYVSGYGECVGIPELIPGRFIKVDRFDKSVNGNYYVKKVRHIFDENGYYTQFEVGGNAI